MEDERVGRHETIELVWPEGLKGRMREQEVALRSHQWHEGDEVGRKREEIAWWEGKGKEGADRDRRMHEGVSDEGRRMQSASATALAKGGRESGQSLQARTQSWNRPRRYEIRAR